MVRRCFPAIYANFCIKFRLKYASHSSERKPNILHLLTFVSRCEVKITSFCQPLFCHLQPIWRDKWYGAINRDPYQLINVREWEKNVNKKPFWNFSRIFRRPFRHTKRSAFSTRDEKVYFMMRHHHKFHINCINLKANNHL